MTVRLNILPGLAVSVETQFSLGNNDSLAVVLLKIPPDVFTDTTLVTPSDPVWVCTILPNLH